MKKIIALTLALLMSLNCFSIISFAEEIQKTTEHLTEVPEGYIGVYTVEDLYFVRNDLTANYILMNDIDLSEATAEGGEWNYGGRGWNPIGSNDIYSNGAFSGVFEGNNYSITGLNIDIDSYPAGTGNNVYVGLFANVSGTVKNLTVGGKITTERIKTYSYSGYAYHYFGGIAACADRGTIQNCKSKINMYVYSPHKAISYSNYSVNLYVNVGGIVGYDFGATIENCVNFADLNVRIESGGYVLARCAGIVAIGVPTRCINSGNITAINCGSWDSSYDTDVFAYGIARDGASYCFNTGNIVSKEEEVNKYIGYSSSLGISGYAAQNCYNVGKIEGITLSNAISNDTDTKNCYYLEGSGQGSTGATSLTEAQMKLQGMYAGWDFDTIWTMEGREDYPYPELRDVPLILPEDLNHKHEYTSEVTKEATHLEEGETTYTCECGDSYTEPVTKLVEHTYTSEVTTEPTHLTEGVKTFTCACGDSYTEPVAKLKDHTYTSEVTTEPTHLTEGVKTFTCACGDSYTEPVAKLTGHTYKEVVTEPTCTTKGYTTYTCECGDNYVDNYVGTKEHSYSSSVTTPATHTKEGVMTYTCSSCGDTYTASIAKTPEHAYTNSYVVEPTCEKDGYTAHICECGDITKDNYIEKTGHSYNGRVCESCGKKCSCMCHYSGIMRTIWKIINFFYKLFRVNKTCPCGAVHY